MRFLRGAVQYMIVLLGMTHTIGKSTMILTQDADIPFDINHIRLIKYQYTPRRMEAFDHNMERCLRHILGRLE